MSVLTVAQAKDHLNISTDESDAELSATIDQAEAAIASRCGPLQSVATTSRVRGRSWDLALPVTPVVSLTSVTPVGGVAMDVSTLYVEPMSGVVEFDSGFGYFPAYRYTVVYQAGRSTVPDDLLGAVKELVRHLWQTQRGNSPGSALPTDDSSYIPGSAYALPIRVEQLIAPYVQAGFA